MAGVFAQIAQEMANEAAAQAPGASEVVAAVDASPAVDAAPVEALAAFDAAAPEVGAPAIEAAPALFVPSDMVAAARYEDLERQAYRAHTALEQSQARIAALESQVAQSLAAQNPAAAAVANASSAATTADWLAEMEAEGVEIPASLKSGIEAMRATIASQQTAIAQNSAYIVTQQKAQANAAYDATFAELQARCQGVPAAQIEAMLAQGFKPRQVEGWYQQSRTWHAPAAPAVNAAPAPSRAPLARVPQLDGPVTPSRAPLAGQNLTREQYMDWVNTELQRVH